MTTSAAPTGLLEETVLEESLLDDELPCSWAGGDNHEPQCERGAEYVRVCPKCSHHRFRCKPHYNEDLRRPPEKTYYCRCGYGDTAANLNATFRPV